jgi:hypothetical protein
MPGSRDRLQWDQPAPILTGYFSYYHATRPHLSLEKDSPEPRKVHPPELGRVIAIPQVGGLHHRYERRAA